jgi:hypothetical protein
MGGLYIGFICKMKNIVDRRFYAIPETLKSKKWNKSTERLKGS